MEQKTFFSQGTFILTTALLGIASGYYIGHSYPYYNILLKLANSVSKVFIDLLQLISIPVIFLSIVATISNMESFEEMKIIGKKVLKYTISTTIISALIALILFLIIDPAQSALSITGKITAPFTGAKSYLDFILDIIPNNMIKALSDNSKVMSVVFIAGLLSFSIISLPTEDKKVLQNFFGSLFAAVLNITKLVIWVMPIGIWAFTSTFTYSLINEGTSGSLKSLMLYMVCILLANAIQGVVVLPIFLKLKGLSASGTAKGMFQALVIAFFSKSSNATLPMTMKCAKENLKIKPKVASFALPLCSVINMNGCAAFILITVLFVGIKSGLTFTFIEMVSWVFIATLAAVGNAGVPMGCYFLASAFLVGMGLPSKHLQILGIILPLYTLIDMVETTLNVWSDSCITAVVNKEIK